MADSVQQFSSISLGSRGGVDQGHLKLTKQGFTWRRSAGGKNVDVKATEVTGLFWTKLASGCQLGVRRGEGSTVNFLGFKDKEFESVRAFCKEAFDHDVLVQEMCISGHNWGGVQLHGSTLMFMVDGKVAFEVPLPDVSGVNQQKDEVMLEFQVDDTAANDAEDTLVEMAFHVPPSNVEYKGPEEGDLPSKMLSEQLLALTDAGGAAAEEAVCAFDDVAILAPRGRFSVEMHHGFLKLSGQTQDFKIRYSSIVRLFLLPKPNSPHTLVVVSLDPPIRKGNTYYSHLLCQFTTDDEDTIELDLADEALAAKNERHNGKLDKSMSGRTFEVFARIIRGLSGAKLTRPGNFENAAKEGSAVRCTYKADDGYLFPLERAFFYVHKPPLLIVHDEIDSVEFLRQGGGVLGSSTRTFDLLVRLKNNTEHQFRSIQRSEWQNLLDFLQAKKLRIENLAAAKQGPMAGAGRGVDLGDDLDPGMAAAAAEVDFDDEEEDEDFSMGDDSGSDSGSEDADSSDAEMIAEDNIPAAAFKKKGKRAAAEAETAAEDGEEGGPSPPPAKKPKAAPKPRAPKAKAEPAEGDGEPKKKGRKKKDPNAPKAGLSAFMFFSSAQRESVKADNPGIAFGEVGKILGERWKALTPEDKAPYEAKAAEDKARYQREMAAFKAGQAGEAAAAADEPDAGEADGDASD